MENQVVSYKFESTKMTISVDPNKDGQAVISVTVDLAECADEIFSALKK